MSDLQGGFSGALIVEHRNGNVEKRVSSLAETPRLRAQCKMQRDFYMMLGTGSIQTPKVYGAKEVIYTDASGRPTAGMQSFEMAKAAGRHAIYGAGEYIPTRLANFVLELFDSARLLKVDRRIFESKIDSVWCALAEHKVVDRYGMRARHGREVAEKLKHAWPDMRTPISHGLYHGDLTLCNVLIDGGIVHLIDFTPQIVPSPLFDMVKLRQDTEHFWYEKVFPEAAKEVSRDKMREWDGILADVFACHEEFKRYYQPFQALGLLRILPYAVTKPGQEKLVEELIKKVETCIHSF